MCYRPPGNVAQNAPMPSTTDEAVEEFEAERPHLAALAYRMLGSVAEAQDVLQEAWLRFSGARDDGGIRDVRGWLTTVTGRICLDVLKSARVAREAYPGNWLPEIFVDTDADPAGHAVRRDQVGLALLVVMERLSPEQRVALVLHDAFGMPFGEVAEVLGSTEATARQHASRARRAVAEGGVRHTAAPDEQRRVLTAFLTAASNGDLTALAAILAPDVVAIGDGGGAVSTGTRPIVGADKVARLYLGILANRVDLRDLRAEPVRINGEPGVLVRGHFADGSPLLAAFAVTVDDGRITGVFNQMNPTKLLVSDAL
jgi:RNA polymerase sigma-70 factor (ECF subfamily)